MILVEIRKIQNAWSYMRQIRNPLNRSQHSTRTLIPTRTINIAFSFSASPFSIAIPACRRPVTYCGRLTIPILLWFGAQTRKRRSADTRYNGAPAAVSSSILARGREAGQGRGRSFSFGCCQRQRRTYREDSM